MEMIGIFGLNVRKKTILGYFPYEYTKENVPFYESHQKRDELFQKSDFDLMLALYGYINFFIENTQ